MASRIRTGLLVAAAGCLVSIHVGCGGTEGSTLTAPAPASATAPVSASASASVTAPAPAPASASASASAPAPAPAPAPSLSVAATPGRAIQFPPDNFNPIYARTAKPDDGVWRPMPEGAAPDSPVMYRSVTHSHPIKGFSYVTIVAVDLRRVELRLIAGTLEPESKTVPVERRPGLIPAADQSDLFAVFNGGFMARHGQFGMMIDGDTFLPPRPDACTVALQRDRSVRVQTFTELQSALPDTIAYRQTPPCIIEKGVLHPNLESEQRPRKWGAAENGDTEIRRSALGIDPSGRVLFYGLGEWTTVKVLADAMQAAGVDSAAQLDINWSYTRFLLFARPSPDAPPAVTSTLIPKIKHTQKGYVTSPSERDFFYLKRLRAPAAPRG